MKICMRQCSRITCFRVEYKDPKFYATTRDMIEPLVKPCVQYILGKPCDHVTCQDMSAPDPGDFDCVSSVSLRSPKVHLTVRLSLHSYSTNPPSFLDTCDLSSGIARRPLRYTFAGPRSPGIFVEQP